MGRKKYLDQIDINLLNVMKLNPRYSIAQLGEEIDLSPGPTHTRFEKLRKKGFFTKDYKITYAKFGFEKKICLFEIETDAIKYRTINPETIFEEIVKKLSHAKYSLIESVDLFSDENDQNWVMIHLYPKVNEEPAVWEHGKRKVYAYEYDIFELLSFYLNHKEKYFYLARKVEFTPMLTSAQRMKDKPNK